MGEPGRGETRVSDVTSVFITGDQICRKGVTENGLECDLILNHVGQGLHMRVFGDPNFEDLGRQRKSVEMGKEGSD